MAEQQIPVRVVLAYPDHEDHGPGWDVAKSYADAGMEVIYLGHCYGGGSPIDAEGIVIAAVQEGAGVVAIGIASRISEATLLEVKRLMNERGLTSVLLISGLLMDVGRTSDSRTSKIFGPDSSVQKSIDCIREWVSV